ncbi:hypothetical protein HUW62_10160 [Myxococcus sp. AM011]|uniref:hypothetical protein n=1 Tax=Myxococcus sp. AM011 TaxID=2745200 RepID=UPI0015961A16|nr:hypothetical protein [Myxococcus sp. AM011]NVJ21580.1 hypothetical protein [Myxococcus sp. AM011]
MIAVCTLGLLACGGEEAVAPEEPSSRLQAASGSIDLDGVYPPRPWTAPTVLVDSNFPNGVLNFGTASNFIAFYAAMDSVTGGSATSTGSSGLTPFSASATASTTTNAPSFLVRLYAGQLFEVGTCDLDGASFTGDTLLRLSLVGGSEVASSDDACGGTGSRISYTAPSDGVYEVRMGCYSAGACSGSVSYSVLSPDANGALIGARTFTGSNTNNASANYSTLVLNLTQGQVLDVGTCGLTGSGLVGDTYLKLIDADGNVDIFGSDDACSDHGSRITYTADRTGTFEVRLGCFSTGDCQGTVVYTITAAPGQDQMPPAGFVSAKTYLDNARPGEQPGNAIVDVDYAEFVDDLKAFLAEDDTLRRIVDKDLQVMIEGQLYQLTNLGVFQVDAASIPAYRAWFNTHAYAMNTDPNFLSIPGEVALPNGSYQVLPGVIRTVGNFGTPSVKLLGVDAEGGGGGGGGTALTMADFAGEPSAASGAAQVADFLGRQRGAPQAEDDSRVRALGDKGTELGRISYWSGKVNAHKAAGGAWLKDSDCSSGASIAPLTYCRKFFPGTSSVTAVPVTAKPPNLWNTAGCTQTYSGTGLQEWICDGASTPPASCNQTPPAFNMPVYTVGSNFSRSESVGMPDNRRFVFKAQSPGFQFKILGIEIGFHKIDIKAKLQRKKRFLGIGYWGPSYGDELVVGMDNMKLETSYIVPYPQYFNTLVKPKLSSLADYKIGNWVVKAANIAVNLNPPGPGGPITTQDVAGWISGAINTLIGNVYTNIWKTIERHVMDAIDSTYNTRYAAHTKMVSDINEAHKLRWVSGQGEKTQCYSHENTWWFDANAGIRYIKNGGVAGPPGTPPTQVNYKYSMKAGSFYGRTRIGGSWYGLRFVRLP